MPEDKRRFFRATLLVAVCTFASNILGLLRSTLISAIYGATSGGGIADAYTAAFMLPNIIFTLVASGIISIVLIPYFLSTMKDDRRDELNRACAGFVNIFFLLVSFFIVLGIIFAPFLVTHGLLTGWTDQKNVDLAVKMSRIILLQVFFFTISSVFGSYLNALEKFTAYSIAMLSYNVGIIIGILVFVRFVGIEGVAWGVVFGGFLHFAIQLGGSIKNGFRYSFVFPRKDKNLLVLLRNGVPRILTLSFEQIARFFLVNFGSFLAFGSILIFDNVVAVALVPYGLVAMSVSTTAFPIFIKYHNAGDNAGLYESLFEKIRLTLFLVLPISLFMLVFRNEIINILMGYRNFGTQDVEITAGALGYYCLGIPFYSLTLLIVKFYYAQARSIIPMFVALFSISATLVLGYFLSHWLAVSGLSLGRSIGYTLQAVMLMIILFALARKSGFSGALSFKPFFDTAKIAVICVLLAAGAYYFRLIPGLAADTKLNAVIKLAAALTAAVPAYFALSSLLGIPEGKALLRRIRRRPRST